MRVWNVTTSTVALIDSYTNVGVPFVYTAIGGDGSYATTATFPRQPFGAHLLGRIYRAPAATFSSWDSGMFQAITATCNEKLIYLPLTQK